VEEGTKEYLSLTFQTEYSLVGQFQVTVVVF